MVVYFHEGSSVCACMCSVGTLARYSYKLLSESYMGYVNEKFVIRD